VQKGRLQDALRYIFYGGEGVGKSTLASFAPDAIFFDIEDGTGRLDAARYSFRDEPGGHVPRTLAEVYAAIRDLYASDHTWKSLVLDTADRLEAMIFSHVLKRDSKRVSATNPKGRELSSIEDYGYGKGFQIALDELRSRKNMSIVVVAHATIRTFKNPEGEDYDRWHLRVQDRTAGFLKEWADVVGFCCFEEFGAKLSDDDVRAKGSSTGRRLLKLERTAAYDAKSRIPLPAEVELDLNDPWAPLARAVNAGRNMGPDELVDLIKREVTRIGDAQLTEKVRAACQGQKDTATLSRWLYDLKRRGKNETSNEETPNE
jgi:hypothetical protein